MCQRKTQRRRPAECLRPAGASGVCLVSQAKAVEGASLRRGLGGTSQRYPRQSGNKRSVGFEAELRTPSADTFQTFLHEWYDDEALDVGELPAAGRGRVFGVSTMF
jgi:hypothetical protein